MEDLGLKQMGAKKKKEKGSQIICDFYSKAGANSKASTTLCSEKQDTAILPGHNGKELEDYRQTDLKRSYPWCLQPPGAAFFQRAFKARRSSLRVRNIDT
jgi:hypothetical protein